MEQSAKIEGLRRYTIHGEAYVVVYYSYSDDPDTFHHAQLSADALPERLMVGDTVTLTVVAGVIAGVRRASSPDL